MYHDSRVRRLSFRVRSPYSQVPVCRKLHPPERHKVQGSPSRDPCREGVSRDEELDFSKVTEEKRRGRDTRTGPGHRPAPASQTSLLSGSLIQGFLTRLVSNTLYLPGGTRRPPTLTPDGAPRSTKSQDSLTLLPPTRSVHRPGRPRLAPPTFRTPVRTPPVPSHVLLPHPCASPTQWQRPGPSAADVSPPA